jgi:flagellar basal body-associated protein FliL
MVKLKKAVVIASTMFILGGVFLNSGFVSQKQDEAYASLKEKYGITEEVITNTEEPSETIIQEEVVSVSDDNESQKEVKVDNRTTENIIWDFLKSNGYSDIQTAAIIGNLYQESGLRSNAKESNGEGIGLVQWSFTRKQQLINFCANKGVEWTDLNAQLEFLVKELNSSQFFESYKTTFNNPYSVNDAVEAYCWGFERPNASKANMKYRKEMAWKAYYRNVDR